MLVNAYKKINGYDIVPLLAFLRLKEEKKKELILVKTTWTTDHSMKMTISINRIQNPLSHWECLGWEETSEPSPSIPSLYRRKHRLRGGGKVPKVPLGVTQPHNDFRHCQEHARYQNPWEGFCVHLLLSTSFTVPQSSPLPGPTPKVPGPSDAVRRWGATTPTPRLSSSSLPKGPNEGRGTKARLKLTLFDVPFFNVSFSQRNLTTLKKSNTWTISDGSPH